MTDDQEIEIRAAQDEGAYVIDVGGLRAGRAEYLMRDGRHIFTHTEIDADFSRRGLANKLVKFALDDVLSGGGQVVPLCPFFAAYIQRHPDYEELVDHKMTMDIKKRRERG
ncbi:MAG TPA: GNAT family N-acetyltransferase [Acidimicrobiia bacterium]